MPLSGASSASGRSAWIEGGATGAFMTRSLRNGTLRPPRPPWQAPTAIHHGKANQASPSLMVRPRELLTVGRAGPKKVADLGQKLHLGRHLGLLAGVDLRVCLALQPVHALDDEEQDPGDDHEVDGDGDEVAPAEHGGLLLRVRIGEALLHAAGERRVVVREVEPARDRPDEWHEDVADDRIDDLAEGRADDHADGEIDHIAAKG